MLNTLIYHTLIWDKTISL